jgi:glycosyltransferase involved in cell wall biosynthesis
MRILLATTHLSVVGGVETYLHALLPALRGRGHDVALLHETGAEPGRPSVDEHAPGVPRWRLGCPDALRAAGRWRPDVCYAQGLADPDAEAALLGRFPVVLFAHNYHGTCVSGSKCHAWPGARPCARRLGPGCLLAYGPRRCGGLNPLTMLRLYRRQRRRQALLPCYRAVVVASTHMREEYLRHGVALDRLHLAPLFPTGQAPDPGPPDPRPLNGRVLFVGRLTDIKGGRLLVEAVRLARERLARPLTLVVAGDGPERPALERQARAAGVAAEFHGWIDARQRGELMRSADLLAVPSVWPEPFGLVGVEAGCVGLPAVGFAVGGIPDWLRPGVSGELAGGAPPTASGLAAAITRALADPEHRARLGHGAWTVACEFTPERHLDQIEKVLGGACPAGREVRAS